MTGPPPPIFLPGGIFRGTKHPDIARFWPGATLIETSGLGHHDLLHDPLVISRVLDFAAEGSAASEPTALAGGWLEQDLFNREERW